ncbi:hypothetical protein [Bradyrhizobium sp. LVM 105]|uniref:hypothetical protein n=1 Tax=Bradyrhizobium sp. LVM 105 TaxID=2341115 RepID=UPI000F802AD3|nr:hypothetical protein [Bradyrhizobium sp. LVM 105]RTE91917.1 hypothetical protein D6B98_16010 [Bradyrhizobium sp. LVM 105]
MSELAGPLTRVLLRYVGAALITKAGLSIDVTDPDVMTVAELGVGLLCSVICEGWYALARKRGWER